MCQCTPERRTPFCNRYGCNPPTRPKQRVTVRRAVLEDRIPILELALRFIDETRYREFITPNPVHMAGIIDHVVKDGGAFVAVDEASQILVGMIAMAIVVNPISGKLTAHEAAWWLNPEHRGSSAAIELLEHAEEWAADAGAVSVQMIAPAGSTIGRLYARRGYYPLETTYQRTLVKRSLVL